MIFNSISFVVFCTAFFALFPLVRSHNSIKLPYIVFASLFFYGFTAPQYIPLLLLTGGVDFTAGILMESLPTYRKRLLIISLILNLGVLGYFKYSDFLILNLLQFLDRLGFTPDMHGYSGALPIGISFYTFQSINYTISVYRKDLKPVKNPFHFLAFITLFPHLVAGPLVRASQILPQLLKCRGGTESQIWEGNKLIASGYFKKTVLADHFATPVNIAFSHAQQGGCLFWWCIASMFSAQIYCDFSGYTDIARGLAKWIGVEFDLNFCHPYSSLSIKEFWQRWHISLSTWFRDYVYIPLGGSRLGSFYSHRNMWITMLLSGLWHGANWTFLAWAALHAAYLSLERITRWPDRLSRLPGGRVLCLLMINILVGLAWIFFRASTVSDAVEIIEQMLNLRVSDNISIQSTGKSGIVCLAIFWLRELYFFRNGRFVHHSPGNFWIGLEPIFYAFILVAAIFLRGPGTAFIYFQF